MNMFSTHANYSIKNITEMDCFVKAFRVLRKALPKELFTLEKSEEAKARAAKFLSKEMLESWEKTLKDHSDMKVKLHFIFGMNYLLMWFTDYYCGCHQHSLLDPVI